MGGKKSERDKEGEGGKEDEAQAQLLQWAGSTG